MDQSDFRKDCRKECYVLVTPAKNEEENLPRVIKSVVSQTIKPKLWVIVDDGSSDTTPDIIREASEKYSWISSMRLESRKRDSWYHLASVLRKGFQFCLEECKARKLSYRYLATLDADVILEKDYYEKLILKFKEDPRLGIASGRTWLLDGRKRIRMNDHFPGGVKLIRRECFEACRGIPQSYSWDSVMNTIARLKGWKVQQFEDPRIYIVRAGASANGMWNGFESLGRSSYYLGFNPLHAIAKGLKLTFGKPYYLGTAYLYGYFNSLIMGKKQIKDMKIRNYYGWQRTREVLKSLFDKFRSRNLEIF